MRNAHVILAGKPVGKRLLVRPRRRWEDSIRMELREIGWEDVDWMHLAQDTDQWWDFVNLQVSLRARNSLIS
jgi:hypothetical protein